MVYLHKAASFGMQQTGMLTRGEALPAFGRIGGTVFLVMPVADINYIYYCCAARVVQDGILYVFGRAQADDLFFICFAFPLANVIEPELHKMQGAGKFLADELYYAVVVFKILQALADKGAVQGFAHRMRGIVKLLRHENAFIACKRRRF